MKESYPKRWYGIVVLSIVLVIVSLDSTVLDVAIPSISNSLGATAKDLQWLIDIYILVFASLLLTLGALGDRHGRKMMLQIGTTLFGIASLGAALSTSIDMLIAFRGLTGLGAGMMMPATLSIITDMFADKEERQKAFGIWGMMFGIGFGFGPLLGGWLVDNYGWESVFFINIPIVLISLTLGAMWLPESSDTTTPKTDMIGMSLSVVGLFLLTYGIIEAGMLGWSQPEVLTYLVTSIVILTLFIFWEQRIPHPMLPLELFYNPSFSISSIALTLAMFGMMGTMFFFSQFFQTVQHFSATSAGLLLIPLTIGIMVASSIAPKLLQQYGLRRNVSVGITLAGIALLYFAYLIELDTPWYIIAIGFFLQGFGFGMAMMPATDAIMASIPEAKLGVGSAMNDTTRELGGALSIAILGALVNNKYIEAIHSSTIEASLTFDISRSIQSAHIIATNLNDPTIISIADIAFIDALSYSMYIGAVITFVAAIITYKYLPDEVKQTQLKGFS